MSLDERHLVRGTQQELRALELLSSLLVVVVVVAVPQSPNYG